MIVREQIQALSVRFIDIDYEGSGDPAEEHSIIGITFRDKDGNILRSIGEITDMPDKSEYMGVI